METAALLFLKIQNKNLTNVTAILYHFPANFFLQILFNHFELWYISQVLICLHPLLCLHIICITMTQDLNFFSFKVGWAGSMKVVWVTSSSLSSNNHQFSNSYRSTFFFSSMIVETYHQEQHVNSWQLSDFTFLHCMMNFQDQRNQVHSLSCHDMPRASWKSYAKLCHIKQKFYTPKNIIKMDLHILISSMPTLYFLLHILFHMLGHSNCHPRESHYQQWQWQCSEIRQLSGASQTQQANTLSHYSVLLLKQVALSSLPKG